MNPFTDELVAVQRRLRVGKMGEICYPSAMHRENRPQPPDYGILFNNDGTMHGASEYPQRTDDLLDKIYGPLKDTQVGAFLWCVGAEKARWPSDRLESDVASDDRSYDSVKEFRRTESLRAMFDRGEDVYGAIVRRGRELGMDVYASIRMNDNHFWSDAARKAYPLSPEEMAKTDRPHLTQFRKEHPEWTLGIGNAPRWAATSWNMAVPEVREYTLLRIEEACGLADWDGVEIDWQRHAFHLPEFDAYRLRYALTDLQRAIRVLADTIAAERGRPFYVIVRVGASEETNRRIGYDVETWIEDGLCDIVATNANSGNAPGVEVERYVELMDGTSVKLYPGFDSHGEFGRGHLLEQSRWREGWLRGLAMSYYERGATGVHAFNWHNYARPLRPLLTTLGSPRTLAGENKVYTPIKRHIRGRQELRYGAERDDRLLGETPVCLYPTMTGIGPTFEIRLSDDASCAWIVELQVNVNHYSSDDVLTVKFDGKPLGEPTLHRSAPERQGGTAQATEDAWLVWQLDHDQSGRGVHELEVVLIRRDPRICAPIVVENVELHVTYHTQGACFS